VRIVPLTLDEANDLVAQLHRHHKPVQGHRFSIGCEHEGRLVGAATVGRPPARNSPQYTMAKITRCVTDGTFNACSFLYGAAARVAKEMGFDDIETEILEEEIGASLKAAGFKFDRMTDSHPGKEQRPGRRHDQPEGPKQVWVRKLRQGAMSAPTAGAAGQRVPRGGEA
jgi:hypothetical protein